MAGESKWTPIGVNPIGVDVSTYKQAGTMFDSFISGTQKFTRDIDAAQKSANLSSLQSSAREFTTEEDVRANKDLFSPENLRTKYGNSIDLKQAAALEQSTLQTAIGEDTRLRGIDTRDYINQVGQKFATSGETNQGILRNVLDKKEALRVSDAAAADQEYIANSGKLFDVGPSGQVVPRAGTTIDQQKALSAQLRGEGFGFASNFGTEEEAFKKYAFEKNLTNEERTSGLARLEGAFTNKRFTAKESAEIAAFSSATQGRLAQDEADLAAATQRAVDGIPLDKPLTGRAKQAETNQFIERARTLSPNKELTGKGGGVDLSKVLLGILEQNPGLESWELEGLLTKSVDGENDAWMSFDTAADVSDLKKNVKGYLANRGTDDDSRQRNRLETVHKISNAQRNKLRTTAASVIKDNQATWDARSGGANPGRNKKYKSGLGFAESVANVKKLKETAKTQKKQGGQKEAKKSDNLAGKFNNRKANEASKTLSAKPVKAALKDVNLIASNQDVQKSIRKYLKDKDLTGSERAKLRATLTKAANTYRDDAEDLGDLEERLEKMRTRKLPSTQTQFDELKAQISSSSAALALSKKLLQRK